MELHGKIFPTTWPSRALIAGVKMGSPGSATMHVSCACQWLSGMGETRSLKSVCSVWRIAKETAAKM